MKLKERSALCWKKNREEQSERDVITVIELTEINPNHMMKDILVNIKV
jgi:hypothetical protein